MEKLIIQGGNRLEGRVRVSSAKNAVLPIIAGTLLASTPSKLLEIPNLEDVGTICQVIESLGVKITRNNADGEIVFLMNLCVKCVHPFLSWVHFWLVKGRLKSQCLVDVLSVHVPLIFI